MIRLVFLHNKHKTSSRSVIICDFILLYCSFCAQRLFFFLSFSLFASLSPAKSASFFQPARFHVIHHSASYANFPPFAARIYGLKQPCAHFFFHHHHHFGRTHKTQLSNIYTKKKLDYNIKLQDLLNWTMFLLVCCCWLCAYFCVVRGSIRTTTTLDIV